MAQYLERKRLSNGDAAVNRGLQALENGQVTLASELAQQAAQAYTAASADTPDGLKLLWLRIRAAGEDAEDAPSGAPGSSNSPAAKTGPIEELDSEEEEEAGEVMQDTTPACTPPNAPGGKSSVAPASPKIVLIAEDDDSDEDEPTPATARQRPRQETHDTLAPASGATEVKCEVARTPVETLSLVDARGQLGHTAQLPLQTDGPQMAQEAEAANHGSEEAVQCSQKLTDGDAELLGVCKLLVADDPTTTAGDDCHTAGPQEAVAEEPAARVRQEPAGTEQSIRESHAGAGADAAIAAAKKHLGDLHFDDDGATALKQVPGRTPSLDAARGHQLRAKQLLPPVDDTPLAQEATDAQHGAEVAGEAAKKDQGAGRPRTAKQNVGERHPDAMRSLGLAPRASSEALMLTRAATTLSQYVRRSLTCTLDDQRKAALTLARFVRGPMVHQVLQQVQINRVQTFLHQGSWWCPPRVPSRAEGADLALVWFRTGLRPPLGGTELVLPRLAEHLGSLLDQFPGSRWLTLTMHEWKVIMTESSAGASEPLQPVHPRHWILVHGTIFVPRGGEIVCHTVESGSRLPGLALLRPTLTSDGVDYAGLLRTALASLPLPFVYPTPLEMYAYTLSRLLSHRWAQWRTLAWTMGFHLRLGHQAPHAGLAALPEEILLLATGLGQTQVLDIPWILDLTASRPQVLRLLDHLELKVVELLLTGMQRAVSPQARRAAADLTAPTRRNTASAFPAPAARHTAQEVLEKVLLNPAVKTGIDHATAAAPEERRGPFEEMQAFLGSLPSMDSDELIVGVGRVRNAFEQAGEASTHFKFPEDLVASIANPIAILEQLSTVIPAPFDTPYTQALRLAQQLAEFAALVPMIDKAKAGDLKGALGIAVSGPVMLLVAKLAGTEDLPAELLRKILGSDALRTSVSSTLRVMPDGQRSPFQALLDLRLELPLPELVSELDTALKGFQAPAFKAMEMKFPDDLLGDLDHIGILKEIGAVMPEPLAEMYAQAIELAEFAVVLPMIDKLKNGDVKGALALVMTVPVLKDLAKIKPEMARTVLERVLLNPAARTGIDRAMAATPKEHRGPFEVMQAFLGSLPSLDSDELIDGLGRVSNAFRQAGEAIEMKFPDDLLENLDHIGILKVLGALMPEPLDERYARAMELAEFAAVLPMIDKLKNGDVKGALVLVMTAPVMRLLMKIEPEMVRTVLERGLLSPAVMTGIDRATAAAPKEHRGPFEEMQAFLGSLPSLDSDELIDGVGRVRNAFEQAGEASTHFKFPEDLVASIANPIATLEQLSSAIPAPFDTQYTQALRLAQQLAEFAVLVPMIDRMKTGDLKGALGIAVSGPVMLLVAKLAGNEDLPAGILRKILGSDAFKTSVSSTLRVMPDGQKSPFQALLDLRLKLPLPELVSELDKALKGFQAPAFKATEMKFPDDLLENTDHIGTLKELGAVMPKPLVGMYARAMELAEFAPVLPMIDKLKNGDAKGALVLVMTVPVLKLLVKIEPERAGSLYSDIDPWWQRLVCSLYICALHGLGHFPAHGRPKQPHISGKLVEVAAFMLDDRWLPSEEPADSGRGWAAPVAQLFLNTQSPWVNSSPRDETSPLCRLWGGGKGEIFAAPGAEERLHSRLLQRVLLPGLVRLQRMFRLRCLLALPRHQLVQAYHSPSKLFTLTVGLYWTVPGSAFSVPGLPVRASASRTPWCTHEAAWNWATAHTEHPRPLLVPSASKPTRTGHVLLKTPEPFDQIVSVHLEAAMVPLSVRSGYPPWRKKDYALIKKAACAVAGLQDMSTHLWARWHDSGWILVDQAPGGCPRDELPSTPPHAAACAPTEPSFMLLHRNIGGGLAGLGREEGCIGGDGLVAVGPRGQHDIRAADLRPGDMVYSPSLGREVQILAVVQNWTRLGCKFRELRISGKHPMRLSGTPDWRYPRALAEEDDSLDVTEAYNFVLADGGALLVNREVDGGVWVATLGPSPPEARLGPLIHPWYNSDDIVTALRNQADWPRCRGLPERPRSYFTPDDYTEPDPPLQPLPPLLVPAEDPDLDMGAPADSPSLARAALSRLLGDDPRAFATLYSQIRRAVKEVNPSLPTGNGRPWDDIYWSSWDLGDPPKTDRVDEARMVRFGATILRILDLDCPPDRRTERAALLQLLVRAFPWMTKGQRRARILSLFEHRRRGAAASLQGGPMTSWTFSCTSDRAAETPPKLVRGDIVTLCPPVGLAPQAPLYQLPEHARHPLGPQVAATGDGGDRPPGHETGLVVAVTQGSFSCVNTLLVCTEKGTLVQSPANWSTAAAAESQTQRQRLEDLSSLTCAMYLHHSLRLLFPKTLAGILVAIVLPRPPVPLSRGTAADCDRKTLSENLGPFLDHLPNILLPPGAPEEQCRAYLFKDRASLGAPPTAARISLDPPTRGWDVAPLLFTTDTDPCPEEVENYGSDEMEVVEEAAQENAELDPASWCSAQLRSVLGACFLGDPASPLTNTVTPEQFLHGARLLGLAGPAREVLATITLASGLLWQAARMNLSAPGRRLESHALEQALYDRFQRPGTSTDQIVFTTEEWRDFQILDLRKEHYVVVQQAKRLFRPAESLPLTLSTISAFLLKDLLLPTRIPAEAPTHGSWAQLLKSDSNVDISVEALIRVFTQTLALPKREVADRIQQGPFRPSDLQQLRTMPPHACKGDCLKLLCDLPLSQLRPAADAAGPRRKRGRAIQPSSESHIAADSAPAADPNHPDRAQAWDSLLNSQAFKCYIARLLLLAAGEPEVTELYLNWIVGTSVRCILTRLGMPDDNGIGLAHTLTYALVSLHGPQSRASQTALLLQPTSTVHQAMLQVCPEAAGCGLLVAIARQQELRLDHDPQLLVRRPTETEAPDAAVTYCQLPPDRILTDCFQPASMPNLQLWPAHRLLFQHPFELTIQEDSGDTRTICTGPLCPLGSIKLTASDPLAHMVEKASKLTLKSEAVILHDLTPVAQSPSLPMLTAEGAGHWIHFLLRLPTSPADRRVSGHPQDTLATVLARHVLNFSPDSFTVTSNELLVSPGEPLHRVVPPGAVVVILPVLRASALAQQINSPPKGDHAGKQARSLPSIGSIEVFYKSPGHCCPQSVRMPASAPLTAVVQQLFCLPSLGLPDQFYLRVNNTLLRTPAELDTPLSQWRWEMNCCHIDLLGRLRGGMPEREEDAAGSPMPAEAGPTVPARQLSSMQNWCGQLVAKAQMLRLNKDFLPDRADALDGTFAVLGRAEREALLRPPGTAPLIAPSTWEILASLQRRLTEGWEALSLGSADKQRLESDCVLARKCIETFWIPIFKNPLMHVNRVTRLTHNGRGFPIEETSTSEADCITMISGHKDQQEAKNYLSSLGLRTPTQLAKRRSDIVFTSSRPHKSRAGDGIPNGSFSFSIGRSPQAMQVLEAIYSGHQEVAPDLVSVGPGILFVSRRIEHLLEPGRWSRASIMTLEPLSPVEGLKYEVVIRLLTALGLSLDQFVTAMVNMLFEAGYVGAAEIIPDNDSPFATVFNLQTNRRPGRLQVRFCQPAPPDEERSVITFNFSDFMQHLMPEEEPLPGLLQQLSFKLIMQKKDKLTAREREASASVVLELNIRNPAELLLDRFKVHGNNKIETEAEGPPVPLLEEWLCEHVIGFLKRHLSVDHSSLITGDTVSVELTHDRSGRIGRTSQLLIHFTAISGADYLNFTPQVAATLAFQLGFLAGCRGEHTGPYAQLQWCPLLSLLDNYPSVMWTDCNTRCGLARVSFTLHLGPTSEVEDSKPWWKLDNRATTFTDYEITRDPFLLQLERSFLKHPAQITPAGLVLLAQQVDKRGPGLGDDRRRQRDKEEQRIIAAHNATPTTNLITLKTPVIIKLEESSCVRTLGPLCPDGSCRTEVRRGFGTPQWLARTDQFQMEGFTYTWVGSPLPDLFVAARLCEMISEFQTIFSPAVTQIPIVHAPISPFCLNCRESIQVGVYHSPAYVAHCTNCLPLMVGVAAASRTIRLLMDLYDSATKPETDVGPSGEVGKAKPTYRPNSESRRACQAIMDLGPHPLPWLIYNAYPHGGQTLKPGPNVLQSYVEDFTARTCWLAQRIAGEPSGLVAAEAINAHWALMHALSSDARTLETYLRRWPTEAAERSDRNVLHNSTLPSHLLPLSRKREGEVGRNTHPPSSTARSGRSALTEHAVDTSAHTVDRRPAASLPRSGRGGDDEAMLEHLPPGRPPDVHAPPTPEASAAPS